MRMVWVAGIVLAALLGTGSAGWGGAGTAAGAAGAASRLEVQRTFSSPVAHGLRFDVLLLEGQYEAGGLAWIGLRLVNVSPKAVRVVQGGIAMDHRITLVDVKTGKEVPLARFGDTNGLGDLLGKIRSREVQPHGYLQLPFPMGRVFDLSKHGAYLLTVERRVWGITPDGPISLRVADIPIHMVSPKRPRLPEPQQAASSAAVPATREEAQQLLRQGFEARGRGELDQSVRLCELAYAFDPDLRVEWLEPPNRCYKLAVEGELAISCRGLARRTGELEPLLRARELFERALGKRPGTILIEDLRRTRALMAEAGRPPLEAAVVVAGRYCGLARVENGRPTIELRQVAKAMGLPLAWNAQDRAAYLKWKDRPVAFHVGERSEAGEGRGRLRDGRAVVSLEMLSSQLGLPITWDEKARMAYLDSRPGALPL